MKKILLAIAITLVPSMLLAQGAMDMLQYSQQDLTGSSRFMSMGGAMGAVGGDITAVKQNPAGLGVYKSSDLSFTMNLDFNKSETTKNDRLLMSYDDTDFNVKSTGYVGNINFGRDKTLRSINWAFSFNNNAIFNRRAGGNLGNIGTSMTNYIADVTNNAGVNAYDLAYADDYNPYNNSSAPWLSILSYSSYMINNAPGTDDYFQGLYGDGTTTNGEFEIIESGNVFEYNFSLGGDIMDFLYWGMSLGVSDLYYDTYTYYGEAMNGAYVSNKKNDISIGDAAWGLENSLRTRGTGCNFKMGVIVKPIKELRLGAAFHTPTFYSMRDVVYTTTAYEYSTGLRGSEDANDPYGGTAYYKMTTPWRFIFSAATVLDNRAILSFDYECSDYNTMSMSSDRGMEYMDIASDVKSYFKVSNTYRVGAEYRVTPKFSVRAGYSYQDSPVKSEVMDDMLFINTASTTPAYVLDKSTQYITAGLGYSFGSFYTDLAYVNRNKLSEYHAFTPVFYDGGSEPSPTADINSKSNQITMTLGFRF